MRKKKFKVYRKIYPKARGFARREYVECYEREPLEKGYYNGFVDGVKAMRRHVMGLWGKELADELCELVLGKPTEI